MFSKSYTDIALSWCFSGPFEIWTLGILLSVGLSLVTLISGSFWVTWPPSKWKNFAIDDGQTFMLFGYHVTNIGLYNKTLCFSTFRSFFKLASFNISFRLKLISFLLGWCADIFPNESPSVSAYLFVASRCNHPDGRSDKLRSSVSHTKTIWNNN